MRQEPVPLRPYGPGDIVRLARVWIGTPYHHQASVRGVGCDCLGLVRGIWRQLYGSEAEAPPAYSRDWGEANGVETLLNAAARHLMPGPAGAITAGSVLVFRMRPGAVAKHAAIASAEGTMIHAAEGMAVCEEPISSWWRRRLTANFHFPHLEL